MASLKKKFQSIADGEVELGFDPLATDKARLADLPIEQVEPDPDQPRKDVGDIEDLKASIKEHGILQPCIVSVVAEDRYRLIAGERRFTAAKAIGLKTVPCIVRTVEEHKRLEVQLVENIHRKELSPVEEATTYKRLVDEFQLSQRQLATRLGRSPAAINQTLRILSLPAQILEGAQSNERISRSVLLEIAKLDTEAEQLKLYERAKDGLLTVKTAREKKAPDSKPPIARFRYPITTKSANVTVVFDRDEATLDEVESALSEALREVKRRAKAT